MFNEYINSIKYFKGEYWKATETHRNPNESQSNTQVQLPWEVSETTSQLLTLFRSTVKKFGSSPELFEGCLACKGGTKCATLRLLFLCSSYLDFVSAGGARAVKIIGFVGSIMDGVHDLVILFAAHLPRSAGSCQGATSAVSPSQLQSSTNIIEV